MKKYNISITDRAGEYHNFDNVTVSCSDGIVTVAQDGVYLGMFGNPIHVEFLGPSEEEEE